MRVSVYDRKNPSRLLGSVWAPDIRGCPRAVHMAAMPPLRLQVFPPCYEDMVKPLDIQRFTFFIEPREENGGWLVRYVFETDAPLAVLRNHPSWRFPE